MRWVGGNQGCGIYPRRLKSRNNTKATSRSTNVPGQINHPRSGLYPPTTMHPVDASNNNDAIAVLSFKIYVLATKKHKITLLVLCFLWLPLCLLWLSFVTDLLLRRVLHLVDCFARDLLGLIDKPLTRFADVLVLESRGWQHKSHCCSRGNRHSSAC